MIGNAFRAAFRGRNRPSTGSQILERLESIVFALNKKKILLRGAMTKKRIIKYPKFVSFFNGRTESNPFTLSQVAGHGSFVMLAFSYLENDFLNLRIYAVSGIALSIIFQYYREIPLWLPISWNLLFMAINYAMILLLLKERNAADNIPQEQQHLYMSLFQPHGMTSVEFLKLMGIARRVESDAGVVLIQQGVVHRDVYLLQSGVCSVKRDGDVLGKILKYQFMGEMSFLRWQDMVVKKSNNNNITLLHYENPSERVETSSDDDSRFFNNGKFHNVAGQMVIDWYNHYKKRIEKTFDRLRELISEPRSPVAVKRTRAAVTETAASEAVVMSADAGEQDRVIGMKGTAQVACLENCVFYVWDFVELYQLIQDNPRIGLCVEMCMSTDLNNKFHSQTLADNTRKYNQILTGALLHGSFIGDDMKNDLQSRRRRLSVTDLEHEQMVKRLGWSAEQYAAGNKFATMDNVVKYKSLLAHILHRSKHHPNGLTSTEYTILREFRRANHISGDMHLYVLKELGWTLDEFEAGKLSLPP